jgi:hypothetical protein
MRQKLIQFLELPKVKLSLNDYLLLALPMAIWFSYHPVISLGASTTTNFELSLAEIALVLFAITALPRIWANRRKLVKNKAVWLIGAFALWNTVSLIWTANIVRGVLTTGLVWLLVLSFLGMLSNRSIRRFLPAVFKLLVISAVTMSIFAWLQVIIGTLSNTDGLLLCAGCTASQFGFARATGFAIEPQFLGSLLLAPILILFYYRLKESNQPSQKLSLLIVFLVATLFLTLSRGAIYAFALGLIMLLILQQKRLARVFYSLGLAVSGFAIALTVQGLLAQINPSYNETFLGATTKVVHQLSLGLIDLRPNNSQSTPEVSQPITNAPNYSGYVEESTDIRLSLSQVALDTWLSAPSIAIFGAGTGSSGVAMHGAYPDQIGAKEIVQNEYIEILLELGMIGFLLFISVIIGLFYTTRHHKWLWVVFVAFLAQWFFFSGYPNALHIYLIIMTMTHFSQRKTSA